MSEVALKKKKKEFMLNARPQKSNGLEKLWLQIEQEQEKVVFLTAH